VSDRTPLGQALRGLGISREQLTATVTIAHPDDSDSEIAVLSSARLWCPSGRPLTLVTEQVYTKFLNAYPPPWPLPDSDLTAGYLPGCPRITPGFHQG
jgi:hypothetical protein